MTKAKKAEMEEARERLRGWLKPGDTVRTISRHTSRSGMSRSISPIIDGEDWSGMVARAIGAKFDERNGGVIMGGCGMDMGFALVYSLSRSLWPQGFDCIDPEPGGYSRVCPSNDHSNHYLDKRNGRETPAHHSDGGYALNQWWL